MKTQSLLENWQLREEPLSADITLAPSILSKTEGWMPLKSLPCDVHMALMEAGRIGDPLIAANSFDCTWVENRSWWFLKSFSITPDVLSSFGAELFLEILDIHADLFLNGVFIGHHASAMYPFRKEVRPLLKEGENTLLIRLTTGVEYISDLEMDPVRSFVACEWRRRREGRGDERRAMLRKPQYVFGWDQSPRLATCAIAGDARLEVFDEVVVRDIRFETLSYSDGNARILIEVEIESRERLYAREINAVITMEHNGKIVFEEKRGFIAQTGVNFVRLEFILQDPALWWPNGYGDQPLYTVHVSAMNNNGATDEKSIITAVRTVELDTESLNSKERRYAFRVNGQPIYCKGSDFIHSDCIYSRITDELQEKLLSAARDAGFNMLRFWDGNMYERDVVYDLCDRYGILVYQDFCFSCSAYPDHLEDFCREVEREVVYQLKRLRSHPCIALWCGSGENLGLLANYLGRNFFDQDEAGRFPGGTYLYGELLPRLHHALVATVGYQCCSPFGGFTEQHAPERGDMHFYPFLDLRQENQQNRISTESFDKLECKFITECGVMGPPSAKALARYCGGVANVVPDGKILEHHLNTFERNAVRDGIFKHYTGERVLTPEEYSLYGGLFQGTLLAHVFDHLHVLPNCGGSLFWCLNDGFGEVGFSLMDHDGNPKPAYYFVRRAYAPKRLILRREGAAVKIYCSNDTRTEQTFPFEYGYMAFTGETADKTMTQKHLPAFSKPVLIGTFPLDGHDLTHGVIYARSKADEILPATLRTGDFRTLRLPKAAHLTVFDERQEGDLLSFSITSDVFAHAVHFNLGEEYPVSDEYFDLLPGETRRIMIANAAALTGSALRPASVFDP